MDNEVKGSGVQYDYGFRIYDARIARFLSVDPLTKKYPMLTPYQFASNTPIQAIDLDGLEAWNVSRSWKKSDIKGFSQYATTKLQKFRDEKIKEDCANFALLLIVGYAYDNKLPLELTNLSKETFNSSDTKFSGYNEYLNAVKAGVNAVDMPLNTYGVAQNKTQAGDMEIMQYTKADGKIVDFQHVVIFMEMDSKDINQSYIVWGNFPAKELVGQKGNWPRGVPDPKLNSWSIMSGSMNSRFKFLDPAKMREEEPIKMLQSKELKQLPTNNSTSEIIPTS